MSLASVLLMSYCRHCSYHSWPLCTVVDIHVMLLLFLGTMFCCRYCSCCHYVVIISGHYFLPLLLWLFLLLLASPADVVAVAALCLSLANKVDVVAHLQNIQYLQYMQKICRICRICRICNKVDVVAHRLATRHVLPLAGVVPTVAHHNAVLKVFFV